MYLRCLPGDRPRQWLQWLSWDEFCYNSGSQSSLGTSPFKVVYGCDPPTLCSYTHGEARLSAIHQQLTKRDGFLAEIKERLELAQQHYKAYYDRTHRDAEFQVGQWVWLRLLHRPVASLPKQGKGKLGPKFFGPFKILECIGSVAYKLQLPEGARIHNVFHVGLLKNYVGEEPTGPIVLPPIHHGRACLESAEVRGWVEFLVQWTGQPAAAASWMDMEEFQRLYPSFKLADDLDVWGGGMLCVESSTLVATGKVPKR
jgi:hypothetical protein